MVHAFSTQYAPKEPTKRVSKPAYPLEVLSKKEDAQNAKLESCTIPSNYYNAHNVESIVTNLRMY